MDIIQTVNITNQTNEPKPDGEAVLALLRDAFKGTEWENRLFLVGGYVRDKLLYGQAAAPDDIDLVLEGDALQVTRFLWSRRVADHSPVEFPTFGTAMVHVRGAQVELVTARAETYRSGSRKPVITPGTLQTDAQRRDFTINTFLENLHTGEIVDPLLRGYDDLAARILRTPLDSVHTFTDDPLRMLRACRFAAKLDFAIEEQTERALYDNAFRLDEEHGISFERIRDELNKTLLAPGASRGLELMRETGLLGKFAPELAQMHGVGQNKYHKWDVWTHTMEALRNLPPRTALLVRLGVLFHDIGKPATRTVDEATDDVHFYGHEDVGAAIAKTIMTRLRYSTDEINTVARLVALHMRYGAYEPNVWTDASVRRLIRTVGYLRGDLFTLAAADISACNTDDFPTADLPGLQARMEAIEAVAHVTQATSPLSGEEICARLSLRPGPVVGKIKAALTDAVVAGELAPDDKDSAEALARTLLD